MKVAIKKSECIRNGSRLLIATKKGTQQVKKSFIPNSKIKYSITVEPFEMVYAYSEKMSSGNKFTCDIFSIN